jgi:hypothetical protein
LIRRGNEVSFTAVQAGFTQPWNQKATGIAPMHIAQIRYTAHVVN